jgi:putative chitinase
MDLTKLAGIVPDTVRSALTPDFLSKAGIDGPLRLSNFLGQAATESGNFKVMTENLNYGLPALFSADPKKPALWQKYFKTLAEATPFARKPELIANRIYANRIGNGNEASGDGWRYRGRGYIQLTGKSNYQAFHNWLNAGKPAPVDIMGNPDLVATAPYNLLSAAWFFTENKIWALCDKGVDKATVTNVTKKINPGLLALEERLANTQKIYKALKG